MLQGATAFAMPLKLGQSMEVKRGRGSDIKWNALDADGKEWFKGVCSLFDMKFEKSSDESIANRLSQILNEACRLNSDFLSQWYGFKITTRLDFSRNWGFGSSSSLVYCIAQWADVEPYELYDRTFGGSGYDIACARADSPLLFTRKEEEINISYVDFDPPYSENMYFVYLGEKANSRDAIRHFDSRRNKISSNSIASMSELSRSCAEANSLKEFTEVLSEVENLVAAELKLQRVQDTHFSDFDGIIKSLGAWGGDFVLAVSEMDSDSVKSYFSAKGLPLVKSFDELVYCENEQLAQVS